MPAALALISVALFTAGCATQSVWEAGRFSQFSEPAPAPRLRLYHSAAEKDVLVVYDEISERDHAVKERAYFLYRNADRIEQRRRPRFVDAGLAKHFAPLPIALTPAPPPGLPPAGLYAVASTNRPAFALWSEGRSISSHELPVFLDRSGRVTQVLLTPVAVVADATVVGGVIFFFAWAKGGLNSLGH